MPLYEYRCTSCSYSFEKIQSFRAEPEKVCPKCQGELIRPVTAPALRFEGAGWYVNDYAGKGGAKATDVAASSSDASKPAETKSAETSPSASVTAPVTSAPAASPTPSTSGSTS